MKPTKQIVGRALAFAVSFFITEMNSISVRQCGMVLNERHILVVLRF
jgi:hypothetical protein